MLARLLGSTNKERVLVYLRSRGTGHAREVARFFDTALSPVQKALDGLEAAGALASRPVGATRAYGFNPTYPAADQLAALIDRAIELYPPDLRQRLEPGRTRPRRRGKPA